MTNLQLNLTNEKVQEVDFSNPQVNLNEYCLELVRFMNDNKLIGITAPQVGMPLSIMIIKADPNFAMLNPKIVYESEHKSKYDEGSCSFPGIIVPIKRPTQIRIRFSMPDGQTTTKVFNGLTARYIQHHMDFLNNEIFYKKANRFHIERVMKKNGLQRKGNREN